MIFLFLLTLLPNPGRTEIPKIEIINLAPYSLQKSLSFDGTIHPKNNAEISSQAEGQIISKKVNIGDWVDENQILMEIDERRPLIAERLSKNELGLAKANARIANKKFARVREMFSDSLVSEEVFDASNYELIVAEARYSAALANFEIAQLNVRDCQVRAPFAGQIAAIHVGLGETVMRGSPLIRLAATDTLITRATINASDVANLHLKQHAQIFWATKALTFSAELHAFTTVADPTNHRYLVELISANPPKSVVYGTLVQVDLTVPDSLKGVLINSQALRSYDGRNFSYKIKKVNEQYHLQKISVTVLRELNNGIFLIGEELAPSDQVAAGGALMTDGLQIRIGNSLSIEP